MNSIELRRRMLELVSNYGSRISNGWEFTTVEDAGVFITGSPVFMNIDENMKPAEKDLLGFIDESMFHNKKSGWLFTFDAIYIKEDLNRLMIVPFSGISRVYISKTARKDNNSEMTINYSGRDSIHITSTYVNKTPLMKFLTEVKSLNDKERSDKENDRLRKEVAAFLKKNISRVFPGTSVVCYDEENMGEVSLPVRQQFELSMGGRVVAVVSKKDWVQYIFTEDELYTYVYGRDFTLNFQLISNVQIKGKTKAGQNLVFHFDKPDGANKYNEKDYSCPFWDVNLPNAVELFEELRNITNNTSHKTPNGKAGDSVVETYYSGKDIRTDMTKLLKEKLVSALARGNKTAYWDTLTEKQKKSVYDTLGSSIGNRLVAVVDTSLNNSFSEGYAFTTLGFIDYYTGKTAPYRFTYKDIEDDSLVDHPDKGVFGYSVTIHWKNGDDSGIYAIRLDHFRRAGFKQLLRELKQLSGKYKLDFNLDNGHFELGNSGVKAEKRAYEAASYEYAQKFQKQTEAFEKERQRLLDSLDKGKLDKKEADALLDKYEAFIDELEASRQLLEDKITELRKTVAELSSDLKQG